VKIIDTTPGEQALCLNPNEVLESSTVTAAYAIFGASPRRAKELTGEFFYALETLLIEKREIRRKRQEQGRRLGLARAEQLKKAKTDEA
jgi:hypothetical protein